MIPEKFTEMAIDQAEKESSSKQEQKQFVLGAHFAFGYLSVDIEKLRRILAVTRMANNQNPDIRVTLALKDWDKKC